MQLESHATPTGVSPQQRYATLHRSIEQGIVSDDMWFELASVSCQLGHHNEANRCITRIRNASQRAEAERILLKLADKKTPRCDDPTGPRNLKEMPDATNADGSKQSKGHTDDAPGVVDHLIDAGQYLLHQHMPWLVLTTMLAFPLFVGLSGILTTAGSPLLLTAIAALPGISVLVVIAAMGHEILHSSSDGDGDVPELPTVYLLIVEARNFLLDAGLVFIAFFGVPTILGIADASFITILPTIAIGLLFAPLAFALRQIRRDLRTLSPTFLMRAIRRCGRGYGWIALVTALAFTPAGFVATAVINYPIHVQIAIVGPLCVMPTFAITRLLGTWLDTHRASLGYLMQRQTQGALRQSRTTTIQSVKVPARRSKAHSPAARNKPQRATSTAPYRHRRSRPATRPTSAFAEKAGVALEPRRTERPRPAPEHAPGPPIKNAQTTLHKHFTEHGTNRGAVVVRGAERKRHGAASRRS